MTMLVTRTRPPAGVLKFNRANPIGARGRWAIAPGVSGSRGRDGDTISLGAARGLVNGWPAATFTAGSIKIAPNTFPNSAGTMVVACLLDKDADAGFAYLMGAQYDGTDEPLVLRCYSQEVQLSAYYALGGGGTIAQSVAGLTQGEYVLIFGRTNGASSSVGYVRNGTVTANGGSIGTSPAWANRDFYVGSGANSGSPWRRYEQPIALAGWFDGLIPDEQLISLWANPWQVFQSRRTAMQFFGPSAGAGTTVSVPVGAVSVTGYAPTVSATANQSISVPVGAVSLTGYAPTVNTSASQTIAIPVGAVGLTGYAPSVFTTAVTTISVPAGAVSLAGFAPTISYTTHAYIDVPKGAVGLTGYAPTVTGGESGIWTPVTIDAATWTPQ